MSHVYNTYARFHVSAGHMYDDTHG